MKVNLRGLDETEYDIVKYDDYSKIYFKDPYSRTYIMFDKEYKFKSLPSGFEKEVTDNGCIVSKTMNIYFNGQKEFGINFPANV